MGLFGNLFDFNGDGKASMSEEIIGMAAMGMLFDSDSGSESSDDDSYDVDIAIDIDFGNAADLDGKRALLSELEDALLDLELEEPDDIFSDAYDRWEEKKEDLEDRISDLEDEISELEE